VKIERNDKGGFNFVDVETQLAQLFLAIPTAADPGNDPAANARLFPCPTETPEPELNEEWAQFVVPELREGFAVAQSEVDADLEPLRRGEPGWEIPAEHIEGWLSALNQARLALAARHGVTEEDMDAPDPSAIEDERGLALVQIHLYGLLQECLIHYLG
jgi:hypothetical protein